MTQAEGQIRNDIGSAQEYQLDLRAAVREAILDPENKAFDRRRAVHDLVQFALLGDGKLCRTHDDRLFYFSNERRRLYELDQHPFGHFLTAISGLSPTEPEFRFVLSMLQADAAQTKPGYERAQEAQQESYHIATAACAIERLGRLRT